MEAPLLQIRGDRVEVSDDAEEFAAACRVFRDSGFLRFPALLDDAALRSWHGGTARGGTGPLDGAAAVQRLTAMLSDRRVLGLVRRIVDDGDPVAFLADRSLEREGWHEGPSGRCLAALAVHVGRDACRGSTLEMRHEERAHVVSIPTTTPGDAVLFRFDAGLTYRMCSGTDAPESTFTGRFLREGETLSVRPRRSRPVE